APARAGRPPARRDRAHAARPRARAPRARRAGAGARRRGARAHAGARARGARPRPRGAGTRDGHRGRRRGDVLRGRRPPRAGPGAEAVDVSELQPAPAGTTSGALPVSPSLELAAPRATTLVTPRILYVSACALAVGCAAGFVAQLLTALIALFTNAAFFGR